MTDAHCHIVSGEGRHWVCPLTDDIPAAEKVFVGTHPWYLENFDLAALEARLRNNPQLGVGEIGLDRLKDKTISPKMREVFLSQLKLAAALGRPVVLHGAKCWGQVVAACQEFKLPALLFHGFSRSDGLIPDIIKLGGYISVGPAILNNHALNYRAMVKKIPLANLLLETDLTEEAATESPSLSAILKKTSEIIGISENELEAITDDNANRFAAL